MVTFAGNLHARSEPDIRLDQRFRANLRVPGKPYRLRRNHRHARQHHFAAHLRLKQRFSFRQLDAGIDAEHRGRVHLHRHDPFAARAGDFDNIRQIIFALGILVGDRVQHRQRIAPGNCHQAAIAEIDLPLFVRSILVLADGRKLPVLLNQPPIAGRVSGSEAHDHNFRAACQLFPRQSQRRAVHQRRVAEHDEQIIITLGYGAARRQNRMSGAEPLRLQMHGNILGEGPRRRFNLVRITAHNQRHIRTARRRRRAHRMGGHRQPADRVQHFDQCGFHPRPLAGGKDDGKAGALAHERRIQLNIGKA